MKPFCRNSRLVAYLPWQARSTSACHVLRFLGQHAFLEIFSKNSRVSRKARARSFQYLTIVHTRLVLTASNDSQNFRISRNILSIYPLHCTSLALNDPEPLALYVHQAQLPTKKSTFNHRQTTVHFEVQQACSRGRRPATDQQ